MNSTRLYPLIILMSLISLLSLLFLGQAVGNVTSFKQLDGFDTFLNGNVDGQGSWHANEPGAAAGAIIDSTPPAYLSGKALKNDPNNIAYRGNAYRELGVDRIAAAETATLFFQLAVADQSSSDVSIGVSAQQAPDIFSAAGLEAFAAELRVSGDGLQIRDGNSYQSVSNVSLQNDTLYHIWLVIDNGADTFEVYVDDPYGSQTQLATAAGTTFDFRQNVTGGLRSFQIQNHGLTTGVSYVDNLYISHAGSNLANPSGSFQQVDNFDALQAGAVAGQNGWQGSDTAVVVTDPADDQNQVLQLSEANKYAHKAIDPLLNSERGTLHFRLWRSGTINAFAGLSDLSNPAAWQDFETQIGAQATTPNNFIVRDGDSFDTVSNQFEEDVWYCLWLVVDNAADSYELYVQGGAFTERTQLNAAGQSTFAFRNGGDNPLTSFFTRTGADTVADYYLDDIYVDPLSVNLTTPGGACGAMDAEQPLSDPIPEKIYHDGTAIQVEAVVSLPKTATGTVNSRTNPYSRLTYMTAAPDGSGRLFVNDLRGQLYAVNPTNGSYQLYLDIEPYFSDWFESPGLNSGFSTFAFHPEFGTNGLFYTIHTEEPNGAADYSSSSDRPVVSHNVLTEWQADNPAVNSFSGTKREVLRVAQVAVLHGMQQVAFNPLTQNGDDDYGMLYLSLGDGDSEPYFSDSSQNLSSPQGSILRIDPLGDDGPNGRYGIPTTNPFYDSGDSSVLKEIYAYGFRNPHRFSWDPVTGQMFVSGIGQNHIDELNLVLPGRNYGWNLREGTFRFDTNNPQVVYPLPADDAQLDLTYPVAQYDHDEGFAISGGFVYRGGLAPQLAGHYIFGDIVAGHLFYVPVEELVLGEQATIRKVTLLDEDGDVVAFKPFVDPLNQRADVRFGVDAEGELYLFSRHNGTVYRVIDGRAAPGLDLLQGITQLSTDSAYEHDIVYLSGESRPYTDEPFEIETIPAVLDDPSSELLMTLNSERMIRTTPHLGLDIGQTAELYIAVDARHTPPDWLSSWTSLNETITVLANGQSLAYRLFHQTIGAGELLLGGNGVQSGGAHNYFVLAKQSDTPAVTPTQVFLPTVTATMTPDPAGSPTLTAMATITATPNPLTPSPIPSQTVTPAVTLSVTPTMIPIELLTVKHYLPLVVAWD